MTLNTLIRDIFDACNIPMLRDYSEIADNKDYRLVRQYLNDTATDVSLKYDFAVQEKQFNLEYSAFEHYIDRDNSIVPRDTDILAESLDIMVFRLPSDFARLPRRVSISYNREQFTTGIPIGNQQDWQIWTEFGYSYRNRYRITGQPNDWHLEIQPAFKFTNGLSDENISFSYMTEHWLRDGDGQTYDSVGTNFNLMPILDHQILKFGTIYQYKMNKGEFETASVWKKRYDTRIKQIQHDQRAETFIPMAGSRPGGFRQYDSSADYFLPYIVEEVD